MNQAEVAALCTRLGVRFVSHREGARYVNLAAWARLAGYKNYAESVWLTMRPYIVHPTTVEAPESHWQIVAHELVHFERQPANRLSLLWWIIKYGLRPKFRALEEMRAHIMDIKTGRIRRDVPHVVERMREWYRLGSVDPEWMVDWMEKRLAKGE